LRLVSNDQRTRTPPAIRRDRNLRVLRLISFPLRLTMSIAAAWSPCQASSARRSSCGRAS
jgi:hypothetical protein